MSKGRYESMKWKQDTPQETTRLLADTVRLAQETEEIGESTASHLSAQGEVLNNTRNYLDAMNDISSSARVSIQNMKARAFRRKFYLWAIIIGLLIANLFVIVIRFRNGGKLYSTH